MDRMAESARQNNSAATSGGLVVSEMRASMVAVMASNTRLVLARQIISEEVLVG
jgi:hypothetical protein